jgi:hypothetical protein
MSTSTVHFHNIVIGRAACGSSLTEERPLLSIDPRAVTCPACLRYLRLDGAGEVAGTRPPDGVEGQGKKGRGGGG